MHQYFISFYCWIIFHCMDVPHFIYPFRCWWTFRFFLLAGGAVVYALKLLWIILLWVFMCNFLCGCMFIFFLTPVGAKLMSQMVTPCLTFWGTIKLFFQNSCTIVCFQQQCRRVPACPHPTHTCYYLFIDHSHLVTMKWWVFVVLIFIY